MCWRILYMSNWSALVRSNRTTCVTPKISEYVSCTFNAVNFIQHCEDSCVVYLNTYPVSSNLFAVRHRILCASYLICNNTRLQYLCVSFQSKIHVSVKLFFLVVFIYIRYISNKFLDINTCIYSVNVFQ